MLLISQTWTNFSGRAFSAAGPRVWSNLTTDLTQPDLSYGRFRQTNSFYLVSGTKAQCESPFNSSYLLTYILALSDPHNQTNSPCLKYLSSFSNSRNGRSTKGE